MIYITGDTHIPIDIHKLNMENFPEQKDLTKDDFVIICGDFGGVWKNDDVDIYWRKWLDEKSFTTLFIDGNHENFDLLKEFEIVDFSGGKARKISDSIYHLMRGQIYTIEGNRFFTFGGADSHDKGLRTAGKSWWKEEMPSAEELEYARQSFCSVGWQVDYIITHCAPTSIQRCIDLNYESDMLTHFLEEVKDKASYKAWYFGHYHTDRTIQDIFYGMYKDILPI